jgi:DNA repair exonuclease SbcCD ATPase subunit
LHQQNTHLNYLLSKIKQELAEKDSMIGRSLNDNDAELNAAKNQLEQKKQEISQLASNMREIKSKWKED